MGAVASTPQEANSVVDETVVEHEDFSRRIKDGILGSINSLWQSEEHTDFVVVVDNTQIRCHSFILCACSNYFARLLRSSRGENNAGTATFNSFSKTTFETILEALYTGKDIVTSRNVIDVWCACHELEISFMVDVCEDFILKHLTVENIGAVHRHAVITGSEKILQATFEMMLDRFDVLKEYDAFLELTFDNLLKLIDSHDLVVTSEDTVVNAILKWVKHDPSWYLTDPGIVKRKECLGKLFSAARLSFVSSDCIEMLMACEVVKEHREAKEALDRAIVYQLRSGQRHGQWPSSALHRKNSQLENIVVAGYADGQMSVLSATDLRRWHQCKPFSGFSSSYITLTAFDNTLYAFASPKSCCFLQPGRIVRNRHTGVMVVHNRQTGARIVRNRQTRVDFSALQNSANTQINVSGQLFILKESEWQMVTNVSGTEHILVPHGESIYFFHPVTKKVQKLDFPFQGMTASSIDSVPANGIIFSAVAYERSILVFCQELENATETTVRCLDTVSRKWSRLSKLQGHADIVSFRDDKSTYILQGSGAVHKIMNTYDGQENFSFIEKLWDFQWMICGCVSVRNTLFICGEKLDVTCSDSSAENSAGEENEVEFVNHGQKSSLTGVFDSIQYISGRFDYFQPVIIHKNISFH